MIHSVIGPLNPCQSGGWRALAVLPAFKSCYERWNAAGVERPDTRDEAQRRGEFWVYFLSVAPGIAPRRGRPNRGSPPATSPPSDEQAAAFAYLVRNQEGVAHQLFAALARQAPVVFRGEYAGFLSDAIQCRIATADGIMGAVELEAVNLGLQAEDGCVRAGFAFHSDLLEPEHGVGVVMHRDRVVSICQATETMEP